MGRNKKDATQDVLNLYNQMQEDENIESGKEEIKVTLKEIESAKKALYEAKEELGNAYRRLESTKVALMAAHRSTDNIVDSICHAIVKAEQSNLKVGINDEGVAQLDKWNNTDRKSTRLNSSHQIISYAVFCLNESAISRRVHTSTVAPMPGCSAWLS